MADNPWCTLVDPDLLGLGSRVGIYLQLLGNLMISLISPEEAIKSVQHTNILMSGIVAAIAQGLAAKAIPPAAFISAIWLSFLDCVIVVPILVTSRNVISAYTIFVFFLRMMAASGMYIWFWFV